GQTLPAGAQQPSGKNPFHDQGRRQQCFYSPAKRLEMITRNDFHFVPEKHAKFTGVSTGASLNWRLWTGD
ncbi:hypothetical protein Nmel_005830, partial [Mimus melanotis]